MSMVAADNVEISKDLDDTSKTRPDIKKRPSATEEDLHSSIKKAKTQQKGDENNNDVQEPVEEGPTDEANSTTSSNGQSNIEQEVDETSDLPSETAESQEIVDESSTANTAAKTDVRPHQECSNEENAHQTGHEAHTSSDLPDVDHSTSDASVERMRIIPVPCLSDNYSYLLIDEDSGKAAAVDVAESEKILNAAKMANVSLTHILSTHHHNDHDGGNKDLVRSIPQLLVYGGDRRIKSLTNLVRHEETFNVGNLCVKTLFTPCHTSGHVLYYIKPNDSAEPPAIFTGDTLFVGGCGRFFEGTPEQMHHALNEVIALLPLNTMIYCGHEYTISNLEFAQSVEPSNQNIADKLEWARGRRAKNMPTVPSSLKEELSFNPFMRLSSFEIIDSLKLPPSATPVNVMERLRIAKNNWR